MHQHVVERNKRNRQKPKTPEQLEQQRRLTKLRVQKHRAKQKAESEKKEVDSPKSAPPPRITRAAAEKDDAARKSQRAKWVAEKRAQREKWNGNKWHWHRKKNLEAYHARMALQKSLNAGTQEVETQGSNLQQPKNHKESDQQLPTFSSADPCLSTDAASANQVESPISSSLYSATAPADPSLSADAVPANQLDRPNSPCNMAAYVEPASLPTSTCTPAALRKAIYRAKQKLCPKGKKTPLVSKLMSGLENILTPDAKAANKQTTPQSKKLKAAIHNKIENLKRKRDKKSLASRKLLLDTVGETRAVSKPAVSDQTPLSPYKRRRKSCKTAKAISFLEDTAVDLPGKKSVSKRTRTQKKVLPNRMKRLHADFQTKHPQGNVSLRTLYRHLPKYIKTAKSQVYRQCLCEICENVDLKLDALNPHITNPMDGRDVASEMTLCKTPSLACYERECQACGVHMVQHHINNNLTTHPTTEAKWKQRTTVKKGKSQRQEKVDIQGTVSELVAKLCGDLKSFSKHVFTHRFQYMQYKQLISTLPSLPQTAVAVFDFAENHLCRYQDEVQSAHWGYNQVTVHPTVLYYPCTLCSDLVTEYIIYLSDDLQHDSHFVKHVLDSTEKHLNVMGIRKIFVWSDGCAAQYKSKMPFFYASKNRNIERAYFGSRHGKGPCDACGGVIKSAVDHDVQAGLVQVQSAQQMYCHLTAHYLLPDPKELPQTNSVSNCCHRRRSFQLVETADLDRSLSSSALHTVHGTRQIHQLRGLGSCKILTRKLACFCKHCLGLGGVECSFKDFVRLWESATIKTRKNCLDFEIDQFASPVASPAPSRGQSPETEQVQEPHPAAEMEDGERVQFFASLLEKVTRCSTVEELYNTCRQHHESVCRICLPASQNYISSTRNISVDRESVALLPETAPTGHLPINVQGDGNCLPRAVSLLVYGKEDYHIEMRVRMVMEMVCNLDAYLSPNFLAQGSADDGNAILALLQRYAEVPVNFRMQPKAVLEQEIFQSRTLGQYCGMWHLYAVANVVRTPVHSVFPDKGPKDMQFLTKRLVQPQNGQGTEETKCIMWTSHRGDQADAEHYWTPNHFVPLLPLHPQTGAPHSVESNEEEWEDPFNTAFHCLRDIRIHDAADVPDAENIPETQEFYWYTWEDKKDYICEVLEVLVSERLVHIQFLHQQGPCFFKPSPPDVSWESLPLFQLNARKVSLQLDEAHSTNRRQAFTVSN